MRASDLEKRLRKVEESLEPARPLLHDRRAFTDDTGTWDITCAPVFGARPLIVPAIMDLDTWEAQAAASQDKLVMEARDQRVQAGEDVPADTSLQYRNRRH